MRRALLVAVAILVVLFVVADRIAVRIAEDRIATAVQADAHLARRPHVVVHGFPFLLQAVRGRYDRIDVQARGIFSADPALASGAGDDSLARLEFRGVRIPLSRAINDHVTHIGVDQVDGSVEIPFADIAAHAPVQGVSVAAVAGKPDEVQITTQVDVAGVRVGVGVEAKLTASDAALRVSPVSAQGPAGVPVPASVLRSVQEQAAFTLHVPALPTGVRLTGVSVDGAGVAVTVFGQGLTLVP